MADSNLAVTGGNVDTRTASNGDHRQVLVIGDDGTDVTCMVDAERMQLARAAIKAADLIVTAVSTAGGTVTLTLPAVAARFHHICELEISLYNTGARTGGATPVIVTSTNLFGVTWQFETAGAIGTVVQREMGGGIPQRSQALNTATTIVCPGVTGVMWRLRARYYTSI